VTQETGDHGAAALVAALRRASVVLDAMASAAQQELGVTRTDLGALELLTLGRLTAGEVARRLGVSSGTASTIIDRLAEAGLAERLADPSDGRRTVVAITARGRRRFERAFRQRWDWLHAVAGGLSPAELEAVVRFLDRVPEMMPR
jgi:DNA-binding MarR family transcriptional regulator